jgi:hypothetical protein
MPIDNYKIIRDYFKINTDWSTAVNLIYKNTDGQRHNTLWFKIKNRRLFDDIPDLKPLFEKIKVNFEDGKSELLNENSNKSRLGIINAKYNFIKPKLTETIVDNR